MINTEEKRRETGEYRFGGWDVWICMIVTSTRDAEALQRKTASPPRIENTVICTMYDVVELKFHAAESEIGPGLLDKTS